MIAIYEPIYQEGQVLQEPSFLPLHVGNTRPQWREFAILVEMYRKGLHRRQALTGLLSPNFRQRSGWSGEEAMRHIEKNPGAEVYLLNPSAHLAYFGYNMWIAGEFVHPGLNRRAQALLDACAIGWRPAETPRQGPDYTCYGNFWVGNEKFWDDYVGGVLNPIAEYLERYPESETAKSVSVPTYHYHATPFLPFIVERLLSTYLQHAQPRICARIRDPLESCRIDFERDVVAFVRHRVDRADRDGNFPADLIAWMGLMCRLRERYRHAYHASQPHFLSGRPIDRELIEIGEAGLDTIPIVPLPA